MRRLKDIAPDLLDGLKSRALRDLAIGRIGEADCSVVTSKIDDLTGYILNMKEEEE